MKKTYIKILNNKEIKINVNVFTITKFIEIIKEEFLNRYYCDDYFNSNLYVNKIYITDKINNIKENKENKKEVYYNVNEIINTLADYGIYFK